jgi:hypothetical protein
MPMQEQGHMILFAGLALGMMWYMPDTLLAIWHLLQ